MHKIGLQWHGCPQTQVWKSAKWASCTLGLPAVPVPVHSQRLRGLRWRPEDEVQAEGEAWIPPRNQKDHSFSPFSHGQAQGYRSVPVTPRRGLLSSVDPFSHTYICAHPMQWGIFHLSRHSQLIITITDPQNLFTIYHNWNFVLLIGMSSFPYRPRPLWHPNSTLCFYEFSFLDSPYKEYHTAFVF